MNYRNLNYEDPDDIKKAILNLSCCSSSGSGLELGGELIGGDPNAVLHLDGSSQLATSTNFTYNPSAVSGAATLDVKTVDGKRIAQFQNSNSTANPVGTLFVSYLGGANGFSLAAVANNTAKFTNGILGVNITPSSQQFAVQTSSVNNVGIYVNGITGQTAKLQEWNVNGSTGAYIDSNYQFYTTEGVRIQSNGSGGSIYLGCGYGGGKNIGLSRGARLGWSQFGDNPQSSITYIEANDSTGVMDFGASGGFRFNNYIQTSGYIFNGTLLMNTNRIYNSSTSNGTLQFGSNTIDVVDATLSVTNDDVADITMIVDAITGTTANLQEWQVNGTTVASVTSFGKGNFDRIACSAVQSTFINTQSNSNTVIKLTNGSSDALFYGGIKPATLTDASAPNNSIYYSSTAGKLVYKDSGGTVNNLY